MHIILTKISDDRHKLCVVREGMEDESIELETRSVLFHDLIHFALESTAGIREGFYGLLASGRTLWELNDGGMAGDMPQFSPTMQLEAIVGALTRVMKDELTTEESLAGIGNLFAAYGVAIPPWLTVSVVFDARRRLRSLLGEWNSVPFGGIMTLEWAPENEKRSPEGPQE